MISQDFSSAFFNRFLYRAELSAGTGARPEILRKKPFSASDKKTTPIKTTIVKST
jgi:hypothetical protein